MVAQSRHIGILSRLKVPFANGEPDGRNMDICPDKDRWANGGPSGLSKVLREWLFVRQERADDRRSVDRGGAHWQSDINQQMWPTDQMASIGDGRLSQPRWVSGGI
jgi:hypothetical protein